MGGGGNDGFYMRLPRPVPGKTKPPGRETALQCFPFPNPNPTEAATAMPNTLYYGDNRQVMREHLLDAAVRV